jgi:hypothetical protein
VPLRRQESYEKADAGQVAIRPGEARDEASLIGSSPVVNTMGIVVVAALAATAVDVPPVVKITATRRRTRSAVGAGNRSI